MRRRAQTNRSPQPCVTSVQQVAHAAALQLHVAAKAQLRGSVKAGYKTRESVEEESKRVACRRRLNPPEIERRHANGI